MVRPKRLRSVVQSIAHHGISGLCYVHPHLGDACKRASAAAGEIDLLAGKVLAPSIVLPRPLVLGSDALGVRFTEIMAAEGMAASELASAVVLFQFSKGCWPSACYVRVETRDGLVVEDALGGLDFRRAEILRKSD